MDNQDFEISSLPFGIDEQKRLNSIKNPLSKAESLAALKALSTLTSDIPTSELIISRTNDNKPYFSNSSLFFSLSHSYGISIAATSEQPIGIDIEYVNKKRNFKIANKFFSDKEKEQLLCSQNSIYEFYSIWTKKEALSKISGKGLAGISEQNSYDCFCRQYFLKRNDDIFIISICTLKNYNDITINNPYKELIIYEL